VRKVSATFVSSTTGRMPISYRPRKLSRDQFQVGVVRTQERKECVHGVFTLGGRGTRIQRGGS